MPKLQEIFTTVAKVYHRYGRLAVLQNVFAIILQGAKNKKKLKNSLKKRYTRKKKEKGSRDEKQRSGLKKKALTSTNPRTVKRYEAGIFIGLFFFSDHFM